MEPVPFQTGCQSTRSAFPTLGFVFETKLSCRAMRTVWDFRLSPQCKRVLGS